MRVSIFLIFILMLNAELALSMTDEGQGAGASKWKQSVETNVFDDTKTVTLSLVADLGQTKFGKPVVVVLRCQSNMTEIYIARNEFLGLEAQPVRTRVGIDEATTMDWSLSPDKQATFYPRGDISFIKSLMNSEQLALETSRLIQAGTT